MNDHHDRNQRDSTALAAAARLSGARNPPERAAAVMLAAAQRDLAICRASSSADLVDQLDVADPEAAYAAWLDRMIEYEQWARDSARRSIVANDEWWQYHGRLAGPLADVVAFSVRRARAAIALMLGDDEDAARAAREDVIIGWYLDDELAAGIVREDGDRC